MSPLEFPSQLPMPAPIARFLGLTDAGRPSPANRSLLFDRGMDRYEADFKIPPGAKEDFLRAFAEAFRPPDPADFTAALSRREKALAARGARSFPFITQTRLVVGLGLPHPTETGFLFDRVTGSPYLPGSSVKGLLRAAARLTGTGELEGDRAAWLEEEVRRIFGPELGGPWTPQTGSVVFYDAFPTRWPRLEVDVLTPHHREHNDKKGFPSDWDEPNPVPFLTIEPGTAFRFAFGPGDGERFEGDVPKLATLLGTALDWLGIGAKKSAGYGVFGEKPPAPPAPVPRTTPAGGGPRNGGGRDLSDRGPRRKEVAVPTVKETVWKDVELGWHQGSPAATRGSQIAVGSRDALPEAALEALKQRKKLRADVVVVKISGGDLRLQSVLTWKEKG